MKLHALILPLIGLALGAAIACSSSSSGSACQSLLACCPSAGSNEVECIQLAQVGVDASCASELVALAGQGFCGGSSGTGSSTASATGCAGLTACCDAMTGSSKTACLAIASEGSATVCEQELTSYTTLGECGGSSTSTGSGCANLEACCAKLSGSDATTCNAVVNAGVASSCNTELSVYESSNMCSGSSSSGTGSTNSSGGNSSHQSGTNSTGQNSNSTQNQSSNQSTGQSSSEPVDAGPVCAPHALPSNFQLRTISVATGTCTSADDEGVSSCIENGTSCAAYQSIAGCGSCALSSYTSSSWGPFAMVTTSGAGIQIPFLNTAGCLQKINPSANACALAIDQAFECELAACLPYCEIASATDTAGMDALLGTSTTNGCLGDADSQICASYISAEESACSAFEGDAGVVTLCDTLADATDDAPYIGLFCGGEDAGAL